MKKKLIALLAGALLTTAMAGNALAAFADFDLIRVVYQRSGGTVEVGTELGSVSTLLAAGPNTATTGGAFTSLTGTDLSSGNYYVAYFARDKASSDLWFTGSDATKLGSLKSSSVNSVIDSVMNGYNAIGGSAGDTQVLQSTTNANSYKVKTFANGWAGVFSAGFSDTEASLADLANGAITQDLYYWGNFAATGFGVKVGSITTNADGSSIVNYEAPAAPTPIPPAFFLMGSGLLGMVGLRRKKA